MIRFLVKLLGGSDKAGSPHATNRFAPQSELAACRGQSPASRLLQLEALDSRALPSVSPIGGLGVGIDPGVAVVRSLEVSENPNPFNGGAMGGVIRSEGTDDSYSLNLTKQSGEELPQLTTGSFFLFSTLRLSTDISR